jgi:hypothetical protein
VSEARRIMSGMEKRKMKVNSVLRYKFSGRGIPRATDIHARTKHRQGSAGSARTTDAHATDAH